MPSRIIKESICTSDTIDRLSLPAERFFYRLMTACDDFGCMDARPMVLLARCFPLRIHKIKASEVERWCGELAAAGIIRLYEEGGQPYLQFCTWAKHQQIRNQRSRYPLPSVDINCNQPPEVDGSRLLESNPIQSESNPIHDQSESETETAPNGADQAISIPSMTGKDYTPDFEVFWNDYPRKVAKSQAFKVYQRLLRQGIKSLVLLAGARHYAEHCVYHKTEEQFICHATTFLNQARYEDHQQSPNMPARLPIRDTTRSLKPVDPGPAYISGEEYVRAHPEYAADNATRHRG